MKLRNKKTGEIGDLIGTLASCPYIGIGIDFHDGNPKAFYYDSLTELNEDWEDYKPTGPLIKDEKVRKAVRAWAEASDVGVARVAPFAVFDTESSACIHFYGRVMGDKGYDTEKSYSITELCGEEEK